MARQKKAQGGDIALDFGEPNEKQKLFLASDTRYTAYGGARGGGKTHIVIRKSVAMALNYPGIKEVVIRKAYQELDETLRQPIMQFINSATDEQGQPAGERIAYYNGSLKTIFFTNGSMILFRHLNTDDDLDEFQGKEYDVIFMDEATQFTESQFRTIGATLRGVNNFPKRFYLTCNPGGVGHQWVKRLFITKDYREGESKKDYTFIPATVEDNTALMESSPEYVQMLDLLPEDIRAAHRYGDWDALAGGFFPEFRPGVHTCDPFRIPREWPRYRSFDYGLDMLACYWFAIDFEGRVWVYREYCESRLVVSQAAEAIWRNTADDEMIQFTAAPPDMWSTMKDTGKTMAEGFMENGIGIVKASNNRVQGWMAVKEALKVREDGKPGLMIFNTCRRIINDIQAIQHDSKNPMDCAKEPHEITHSCDGLRYGLVTRAMQAEPMTADKLDWEDDDEGETDYQEFLCGGSPDRGYLDYAG